MSDTKTAAPTPALRVAVIDSDSGFLQVLTKRLDRLGWEHRVLGGAIGVDRLVSMRLGALVVDLAVLGPQAWEYLARVASALPALPIVVCTGQSTVQQRVRGLRLGADDWLSKPCHPEELIARIEAVSRRRRHGESEAGETVAAGEIEVRPDQFQAFAAGRSIDLTRREFELIALLAGAGGRVLEREEIYQRVWGYTMAHGDRSVDVFVRKLRAKLQQASPGYNYIHTHFGVGYRFAAELAGADAAESAAGGASAVGAGAVGAPGRGASGAVGAAGAGAGAVGASGRGASGAAGAGASGASGRGGSGAAGAGASGAAGAGASGASGAGAGAASVGAAGAGAGAAGAAGADAAGGRVAAVSAAAGSAAAATAAARELVRVV
ncbi:MAG TPA: response regulator transcription factor [Solirubrobacteraceae bacterium]|jgi:DNA-binding response OmpR family regulator|nr:response regulator transcription factor [Solirubrobacteraceae bacterium]